METRNSTCKLYQDIVGARVPWYVTAVNKDEMAEKITVRIEYDPEKAIACPTCARSTKLHDHRVRVLRYLDTCQYEMSRMNLTTARAWRIKETANTLWDFVYMKVAREAWKKLLFLMSHSRIPEMIKAGRTIRNYFWGILNAIRLKATNVLLEEWLGKNINIKI
jgi:transposase